VLLSGVELVKSFEYWAVIVYMSVIRMQVVTGLVNVFPFFLTYGIPSGYSSMCVSCI
jgi:hypothetical protein